jgi:stalled ribosome alternative rescue factor ArfA
MKGIRRRNPKARVLRSPAYRAKIVRARKGRAAFRRKPRTPKDQGS